MTFGELAERWKLFAGPITPKPTFDTYLRNLQWVLSHWKDRNIQSITRHDIQLFLNAQAKDYSRSSIRGMQTVLQIILGYAYEEKLISTYPCVKIRCPLVTNTKRCVKRAELNEQQKLAIVVRMKEPYATLTLLFARTPVRVEDAAGIKIADLDGHVWTIRRYVVDGEGTTTPHMSSAKSRSWMRSCLHDCGSSAQAESGCSNLVTVRPLTPATFASAS